MLKLRFSTPANWLQCVEADFNSFLQDHAANERKVAAVGGVCPSRAQISELLQDPASARKVGEAARQRVEESWLWPARISRVREIYEELL